MRQPSLNLGNELIIDLFAGGGGASLGIEQGIGRAVDIAVNHDPLAVALHRANHPDTLHFCESVFKVHPNTVAGHRQVGLLWASPDCTHHSKAKGGKPVSNKRRGLAWVVVKWARRLRPRVIMLENVKEFEEWGPLVPKLDAAGNPVFDKDGKPLLVPCPKRKGRDFFKFVAQLERLGYKVEYRLLRASDYGAPTIRERLFLIARRDGLPIAWPKPTHGAPDLLPVKRGKLKPWRTAAECIDWTIPAPSIFTRKKPLAINTQRRIARGIQRFVLESADPFIIGIDHGSNGASSNWTMHQPLTTITTENRHALVTAFLAKHYGGNYTGPGADLAGPMHTVTTQDHHALVAAHLLNMKGTDRRMRDLRDPAPTICAGGNHAALVAAMLAPYYGSGSGTTGRDMRDPAPTITTKDRLQLVTVNIDGETYVINDIGMRMMQPRELYRAQGFDDDYIIEQGIDDQGNNIKLAKYQQVSLCGNSVSPPIATALVQANFVHEQQQEVGA